LVSVAREATNTRIRDHAVLRMLDAAAWERAAGQLFLAIRPGLGACFMAIAWCLRRT
jgi:hypothetical protein